MKVLNNHLRIVILCMVIHFPFISATTRSFGTFTADAATLVNDLINRLPCDLPTSIHKDDASFAITQSGYYCLADDLTESAPIIITANNVVLNLSGRTIDLSNSGQVGIQVSASTNVTIMNGIIQNSVGSGIHISDGSQKVTVDNITTSNCATGIVAEDSNSIIIKNSLCKLGAIGIQCSATTLNSYDYVIAKSSTIANSSAGIQLTASTKTLLSEVKIRDCHIVNPTQNSSASSPTYGIQVQQTRGVSIYDVTVDTATYGIAITNASDLRVTESKILNSAIHGIYTYATANGSLFQNGPQGLTLENVMMDYSGNTNINSINTSRMAIKNCQLLNAQQNALSLSMCTIIDIDKCTLSNVPGSSAPIVVLGNGNDFTDTVRIVDCIIQNNLAGPNLNGIQITLALNVAIERSTISTSGQSADINGSGILIMGDIGNCLISHCMVTGNPSNNICYANATTSGTSLMVDHCNLLGANTYGIFITNANNCFVRNSQVTSCETGISLVNSQNITINGNIIQNCYSYGIDIDSESSCGIRDNAICGVSDIINNNGIGINNLALGNSKIYHNYAYANDSNYLNVPLVVSPAAGIGAHENLED